MSADEFKDLGNGFLRQQKFAEAVDAYTQGLEIDPKNAILYSNRSVSRLQLRQFAEAEADAEQVIQLRPDWFKGYLRKHKVQYLQGRFEECLMTLQTGHKLCGDVPQLRTEMENLIQVLMKDPQFLMKMQQRLQAAQAQGHNVPPEAAAMFGGGGAPPSPPNFGPPPTTVPPQSTVPPAAAPQPTVPPQATVPPRATPTPQSTVPPRAAPQPTVPPAAADPMSPFAISEEDLPANLPADMTPHDARMLVQAAQVFQLPDFDERLMKLPQGRALLDKPTFVKKLKELKRRPQMMLQFVGDQEVVLAMQIASGMVENAMKREEQRRRQEAQEDERRRQRRIAQQEAEAAEKARLAEIEAQKPANQVKQRGNDLYRAQEFDGALEAYNEAIEIDPTEMIFHLNKASCYIGLEQYDTAIECCETAIEVGRQNHADFSKIAKAYARMGNVRFREKKYEEALEHYRTAQTEHRERRVAAMITKIDKLLKKQREEAYFDDDLAVEAKQQGNDAFRALDYPAAIKHYAEAIRRNPRDITLYNNRGTAYMKMGAYPTAIKDFDRVIGMDERFEKAYSRKGQCYFLMKKYHKALEVFHAGLKLIPDSMMLRNSSEKVALEIERANQQAPDEERLRAAMQDPEIRHIMSDPIMQKALQDMQSNPAAIQSYLSDPQIAANIEKLVQAGVLQMRSGPPM